MENSTRAHWLAAFGLGCLLFTVGCQSLPHCPPENPEASKAAPSPNLTNQHVLELSAEGFLYDLRPGHRHRLITNRFELSDYLEATVLGAMARTNKQKLLLFVHGGLNDRKEGMNHFWANYEEILRGEYYPVFVVWPSGWKETYREHLLWVRQGVKAETASDRAFGIVTTPFTLFADIGRSITRLPLVIANNSRSDIETITPIRNREGGAAVRQYQKMRSDGYHVTIADDYSRTGDRAVRALTYWVTLPIKYFGASLIDGFGKPAWDNMLRRTQQVYPARMDVRTVERAESLKETPTGAEQSLSKRQEKRLERYRAAGLPMFIEALRRQQARSTNFEVTLIGHSMGAIILNRVVRDAQMNFANIIYLGAACSIADFSRSVLPYMIEHTNTQFYNLSLHPVAEAGEWYWGDLPPRGSLLVWLDNFLSNPVTEQERTLGRWRNLYRSSTTGEPIVAHFFENDEQANLKERLHFQAFSVGFGDKDHRRKQKYQWNTKTKPKDIQDRCNHPITHGGFSEMPWWQSDFWWQPDLSRAMAE